MTAAHVRPLPLLWVAGLLVPVLYFGSQVLAAPSFPGFDFLRTTASDLGSDHSNVPGIANTGALLGALVTIVTAAWFALQLSRRVPVVLVALVTLALALTGAMNFWAWLHPLPDPLHGRNPFTVASLILPVLLPLATWRLLSRGVRVYLLINLAGYLVLFAMFTGLYPGPTQTYPGLMQRLLAVTTFVPVAVLAVALRRFPVRSHGRHSKPGGEHAT
ncbi:DUF998 domain-containing protein [Deinococcus apachensis]|uniref:DUF998 domain-containing protein n=1 Tax=Deinococcus apachensis TaxID=309886 RepID=UPI0003610663|nr:DUF998 domain-containing protein [Deinococcus apachensis]